MIVKPKNYILEDGPEYLDWKLPLSFSKTRHTERIEGAKVFAQSWRMKERMKTVSVALVVCLNVGVDPPDIVKTQPCARLECWIDPLAMSTQKALESIGSNLQKQYERWQPRARYKQSLDPTVDDVKKLCTSLRRNAKDERVLFHYNGHGVPKPTINGEIWVFNRMYTQYIPLSLYDLQAWMGTPSIYVYDCSNAGLIIRLFKHYAQQHEDEYQRAMMENTHASTASYSFPTYKNCIHLAACGENEVLPMNPDLPADIFTSCLTTPIKIALRWFVLQNSSKLVPGISLELIDKIPGQLNDRRTVLGELNWIFTAITDTIAWNMLPRDLFQKLFRQDLLVASLFRNYLLAERIMRSYDCCPTSFPKLPATHQHPMWQAWDLSLDLCLSQLPAVLESDEPYVHSPFFEEQLTAFQVWLEMGCEDRMPPEQLPIVLQVLLSQVHRLRALELLSRFLDLGPWAVNLALSVGIFPYVLKLLQSSARELRSLLVFIWAKILAVDMSCQADLVRDNGHKYFLQVLQDSSVLSEYRMMAAFVMAIIVQEYPPGQEVALQSSVVSICLEQLNDTNVKLRQWAMICLARLWQRYDKARWCGVRDIAHEKLYPRLKDSVPEVRATAVYALGTFMNTVLERSAHANNIDQSIVTMLLNTVGHDMSPLVRKELVVALQWLVIAFENSLLSIATQELLEGYPSALNSDYFSHALFSSIRRNLSANKPKIFHTSANSNSPSSQLNITVAIDVLSETSSISSSDADKNGIISSGDRLKRVPSTSSVNSLSHSSNSSSSSSTLSPISYGSFYNKLWQGLSLLDADPFPGVSRMSRTVTDYIRKQAVESVLGKDWLERSKRSTSHSLPPSPSNFSYLLDSPPERYGGSSNNLNKIDIKMKRSRHNKAVPNMISETESLDDSYKQLVSTQFIDWCSRYFSEPTLSHSAECGDRESSTYFEREWRYSRNASMREEVEEEFSRASQLRPENQMLTIRCAQPTVVLLMHPYEPYLITAAKDAYTVWNYQTGSKLCHSGPDRGGYHRPVSRITTMDFINPHDSSLLMVGFEDGSVRIWSKYTNGITCAQDPVLITAWQALPEITPIPKFTNHDKHHSNGPSIGIRTCWNQESQHLLVGGDTRIVRVWDAEMELKLQDIPTGTESYVNSISMDTEGRYVFAVGCGDGSVRIFDRRLPPHCARTLTYREHAGCIITAKVKTRQPEKVVAGCVYGEMRLFDIRQRSSTLICNLQQNSTAMSVHSYADIFACGTVNQMISLYNSKGILLNTTRSHDWFMTPKSTTPVSSLAFHPYRVLLAYALTDCSVSICSVDTKKSYFPSAMAN